MMKHPGLFDLEFRLDKLTASGDPLLKLKESIDFELFRSKLDQAFDFSSGAHGGRPPLDSVLMFKILIIGSLYNLSDDQLEYQISDRLSFWRFLDLSVWQTVPDAKTIWLYRDRLTKAGLMEELFQDFNRSLSERGYCAKQGQMIDASLIAAPRQRMSHGEKETVKQGEIPESWQAHPAKLAQKDRDARWIVQVKPSPNSQSIDLAIPSFGYKSHISIDRQYKFIRRYETTDASCYDGKMLSKLLDGENTGKEVWADTAYRSQENEKLLEHHSFISRINKKKPKGKPMPKEVLDSNRKQSMIRSGVEHVFGYQKTVMHLRIRCIGIKRAQVRMGLANLAYNMKKLVFWETKRLAAA